VRATGRKRLSIHNGPFTPTHPTFHGDGLR
jgi:hypothetical protein